MKRIVAETLQGSMGILPRRLDCAATLAPGILSYETEEGEVYLAVDQGVLVKTGMDVLVSVRDAIGGTDLDKLHGAVKREFLDLDQQEQGVQLVLAKMESGFIRRFMEFNMNEKLKTNDASGESTFSRQVGAQARRMLKARRRGERSVWFGLGMSGLIGWSVAAPTLIGAALGIWIDRRYPSPYSWTLMLLLLGLVVGCFNAWRWVESEYGEMREEGNE